jgi:hypothetical protein
MAEERSKLESEVKVGVLAVSTLDNHQKQAAGKRGKQLGWEVTAAG